MVTNGCPCCGSLLDAATELTKGPKGPSRKMRPGDVSVCFYCGGFLEKRFDLTLGPLSDDDFIALPVETRVMMLRARAVAKRFRTAN